MTEEQHGLFLEELRQIRALLELLAEPAIAQRDAKLRGKLREIVGSSNKKQKSVSFMDGTRTQKEIINETGVNQGDLSRMVGKLITVGLLANGRKKPKLVISIPPHFFETNGQ